MGVHRNGASRRRAKLWRINDHRASRQLLAWNLAAFPHAPGAVITDPDLLRIARQLQTSKSTISVCLMQEMIMLWNTCLYKMSTYASSTALSPLHPGL